MQPSGCAYIDGMGARLWVLTLTASEVISEAVLRQEVLGNAVRLLVSEEFSRGHQEGLKESFEVEVARRLETLSAQVWSRSNVLVDGQPYHFFFHMIAPDQWVAVGEIADDYCVIVALQMPVVPISVTRRPQPHVGGRRWASRLRATYRGHSLPPIRR